MPNPYQVNNATEAQQLYAQYLEGTWSDKFLNYSVLPRESVTNVNRAFVLSLDAGFLGKVWDNIKRLIDPLWIATYTMMGGMVMPIIILFKCLRQHISRQHSINKAALQVLMALKNPDCGSPEEVINIWIAQMNNHHVGCSLISPLCDMLPE